MAISPPFGPTKPKRRRFKTCWGIGEPPKVRRFETFEQAVKASYKYRGDIRYWSVAFLDRFKLKKTKTKKKGAKHV